VSKPITMEELLSQQPTKTIKLNRGDKVTGEVIAKTLQEIVLDLGTKSEGVINKRDLPESTIESIKVGDKIESYVLYPESESGQVILSLQNRGQGRQQINPKWIKFMNAVNTEHTFRGKGVDVNKGGLVVEVSGVRGFVPSSQLSGESVLHLGELVGKQLNLKLVEVDPNANKLIFSERKNFTDEQKQALSKIKVGDKVQGPIQSVSSYGAFASLQDGLEGFIHISQASWEKVEDLSSKLSVGEEIEGEVLSVDENLGRVNLSLKNLQEDPFEKVAADYQPDDVIKATVSKVSDNGVFFSLQDGVEGFMPKESMEAGKTYEVGQSMNVLIDKVDLNRRRILLAPFLTSTSGLIYK